MDLIKLWKNIKEKEINKNEEPSFVYDDKEIEDTKKMYLKSTSPALSPVIVNNLNIIRDYIDGNTTNLNNLQPKDIDIYTYVEELAKAHIFVSKNVKCKEKNPNDDEITKQMLIETTFASYQFQKDNNLPFKRFEDFFNTQKKHPFNSLKKVVITNKGVINKETNGKSIGKTIYLKNDMNFLKYTKDLNRTLSHEYNHKCSHNGTYEKHPAIGYVSNSAAGLNEMCTEYFAIQVIKTYLNTEIDKDPIEYNFLNNDKNKKITLKSGARDYIEITQFYEPLNCILNNKIPFMYYDRDQNFYDNQDQKVENYRKEINSFIKKAFMDIRKDGEFKKTISENRFDDMIDSFSSLAEKYVRNLGLNKSTTPDSLEGASTFKKVEEFFNTFDSITFQKDGENFTQKDLIKEKILGAIYYNDKSSEEAINRLNNKRTFVKEFEENCNTATETIEKSKTSESEITTSIEKTKENETTKDNSKSDDLEL